MPNTANVVVRNSCPSKNVAVLVPLYRTALSKAEEFSLQNTLCVMAGRDTFVIGPNKLSAAFSKYQVEQGLAFRTALFDDKYFASIRGYNALMLSKHFYQSFAQYDYILIVQTDALVFADQLDDWCGRGYSYVGAPWLSAEAAREGNVQFTGVGNGGLSLRKVQDFITFLSVRRRVSNITLPGYFADKHGLARWIRRWAHELLFSYNFPPLLPRVNEDVFWGLLAPHNNTRFTVPTPEQAMEFAFEVAPELLYELNNHQLPLGCHAWERYGAEFWRGLLARQGIELP